ncbi:MSMEG_4193 family putative phosphomutase [Nocardioides campestrisoli]|uniref:MSMEG_4193 family putative phosphomutase n=1 Tax=Nocardioides campestrisoli TaxID=2736757 RepID=UPI0015E78237|nr:MSMEG_4193 family putative phosphomutase [Nocardioides campestrisoli]
MATVILVRHGRTTANASGMLAGRQAGVRLDEEGVRQARAAAERLADVPLAAVVSSPLERCEQTARLLLERQAEAPALETDERLTECDYGDWQGRKIADLAKEDLWRTVQQHPSAAVFPAGESLAAMSARAVAAVRERDAAVEAVSGPQAVWAAVSHGDVIKAILADALGTHLDQFQRIVADPASVSMVRFAAGRPFVLGVNTHAGDLAWLAAGPATEAPAQDAVVGGGAGPATVAGART